MTTQTFPCESTIAYAEEPFGHSRDLTSRAHQFLRRYLWAARVNFAEPEIASTSVNGRTSLVIKVSGREPVKHYRVLCKILFMHRGERAVAFFSNQWRNGDVPFSTEDFGDFDRFVESFQFIKPSFYEDLEDHQQ